MVAWMVCALGLTLGGCGRGDRALPAIHEVDDFSLIDQSGRPVTKADLIGKISVFDFVFTECSAQCELLAHQMATLQGSSGSLTNFQLISVSVDPSGDSPERLTRYAKRIHADTRRWSFLTGKPQCVRKLIRDSFLFPIAVTLEQKETLNGDFLHSDKLVLVDARGIIRGYFEGMDPGTPDDILLAVAKLNSESPADAPKPDPKLP